MDFDCQSCGFSKPIESRHYPEFVKKYVMDGNVMCPKCQDVAPVTNEQAKLLGVRSQYTPAPAVKRASKVQESKPKPAKSSPSTHKEPLAFAATLGAVSSLIFTGVILAGGIGGVMSGAQAGLGGMITGAIVGVLLALLPAFMSSATFRFFSETLKLLIEIAEQRNK